MVDSVFLDKIGLSTDQKELLLESLDRERRFRGILLREGISPKVAETILRVTDLKKIDLENEILIREKIRAEWGEFIVL